MKKVIRTIALVLALLTLFSLVGCEPKTTDASDSQQSLTTTQGEADTPPHPPSNQEEKEKEEEKEEKEEEEGEKEVNKKWEDLHMEILPFF